MIEAGFSRLEITPPLGTLMGGHPGVKRSQGVLDHLFCRAMAVKSGDSVVVFISVDLLFLHEETVSVARAAIEKELAIPSGRVFLSATHTHSGPLTTDLFGACKDRDYVDVLPEKLVSACRQALDNMQPSRMGLSKANVPGIAFNARFIMKDGSIETHPQKGNPDIVAAEGPTDDELLAMHFHDAQGELLGALVNFANHPQFLGRRDARISADYPGRIEQHLRRLVSDKAVVLFGNGACGNICPVNAQDTENIELGETWLDRTGKILADNFESVFTAANLETETEIRATTRLARIPIRDIPESSIAVAKQFLKEDSSENEDTEAVVLSDYGTETEVGKKFSIKQYLQTQSWQRQECADLMALADERARSATETCEISVVAIGNNAIVMVPFELFVEFGLEIKARSPFRNTMIIELANGYSGYVPTKEAFSRPGGYETLTLRSSKLAPEAGDIVVAETLAICDCLHASLHGYGHKLSNCSNTL